MPQRNSPQIAALWITATPLLIITTTMLLSCGGTDGNSNEGSEAGSQLGWTECPSLSPEVDLEAGIAPWVGSYAVTFTRTNCGVEGASWTAGRSYELTITGKPPTFVLEHDGGIWTEVAADQDDLACEGSSSSGYELKSDQVVSRFVTFLGEPDLFLIGYCSGELE